MDKKTYGKEHSKTEYELQLCMNDIHIIAKIYQLLLKIEMEEEQVKECMIIRAKNFCHNKQMDQWKNMQLQELKFTLCYDLKKNFYKMRVSWQMKPEKLSIMCKGISNVCWKCEQHEEIFYVW